MKEKAMIVRKKNRGSAIKQLQKKECQLLLRIYLTDSDHIFFIYFVISPYIPYTSYLLTVIANSTKKRMDQPVPPFFRSSQGKNLLPYLCPHSETSGRNISGKNHLEEKHVTP